MKLSGVVFIASGLALLVTAGAVGAAPIGRVLLTFKTRPRSLAQAASLTCAAAKIVDVMDEGTPTVNVSAYSDATSFDIIELQGKLAVSAKRSVPSEWTTVYTDESALRAVQNVIGATNVLAIDRNTGRGLLTMARSNSDFFPGIAGRIMYLPCTPR